MQRFNAIQPITTSVLVSGTCTYTIMNILAESYNSIVYLALCTPLENRYTYQTGDSKNSQFVVLKQVELQPEAICEVECHQNVQDHPNILPILDYIWRTNDMFIVLEYCPNGDLFNALIRLNSNPTMTQQERERCLIPILYDVLDSISWCHDNEIWHRDIKPENVLIAPNGRALLADFGLATQKPETFDRDIGSAFYMAPELLAASHQYLGSGPVDSAKVDVWALGVLMINMITGRNPWEKAQYNDPAFQIYLQNPEELRKSFNLSEDAWYIIRRMLSIDPYQRPTVKQVATWVESVEYWVVAPLSVVPQIEPFEFDDIYAELEANAIAFAEYNEVEFNMIDTVPEVSSDSTESISVASVYDAKLDDNTTEISSVPEMVSSTSDQSKSYSSREEQHTQLFIEVAANDLIDIHSPRPQTTRIPSLTNSLLSLSDDDIDLVDLSVYDMTTTDLYMLDSQSTWYAQHSYNGLRIEQNHSLTSMTTTATTSSQAQFYDNECSSYYDESYDDNSDDHQTIIDIVESYQTTSTTAPTLSTISNQDLVNKPIGDDYCCTSEISATSAVPSSLTSHDIVTPSLSSASSSSSSLLSRSCTIEQPKPVYMAQSRPVLDFMAKPIRSASTLLQPWADIKEMMTSPAIGLSEIERNLRGKPPASSCFTRTTESCTPFERVGTPACA